MEEELARVVNKIMVSHIGMIEDIKALQTSLKAYCDDRTCKIWRTKKYYTDQELIVMGKERDLALDIYKKLNVIIKNGGNNNEK